MQNMLELFVADLESASDIHRIEEAVMEVGGAQGASADLRTQMVWVEYDNDQVSAAELTDMVANLGYDVARRPSEWRPAQR